MNPVLFVFLLTIKYSHYWPAAGGTNCSNFVEGECISRMASGARWQDYIGQACACPREWPFGTTVELDGEIWTCMDRGGKIRFDAEGLTFVDFLAPHGAYSYGQLVEVKVSRPVANQAGRDMPLFELKILTLDDLGPSEVDSTYREYQVSPVLEGRRERLIAEFGQEDVEPHANNDAEDNSSVALNSRYRDREVRLDEVLDRLEPSRDERPFQYPVNEADGKCVLDQHMKYIFK